jgi:LacI family transcriptional regulator
MQKKPTIRDVARSAGVSDTAVSLAFQSNSRLSRKTRERILVVARELNYVPNRVARTLRYGNTRTIGFVVNDITDPFYSRMIRSAEEIALSLGYSVLFAESNWDTVKEVRIVSNMIESRVRGIIMCFCEKTQESLDLIHRSDLPVVAVDTVPSFYEGPFVCNDTFEAGRLAAQHLADAGCRKPVFFNAAVSMTRFSAFEGLLRGFKNRLKVRGIDLDKASVISADLTIDGGIAGFSSLAAGGREFDGVFCVNDLCAFGVMEAAEKHGRRVGRDLAVMGIDNLEMSKIGRVSLTSIDQPFDKIIELATTSLISSAESGSPCTIRRRLKPTLVVRDSTRLGTRAPR